MCPIAPSGALCDENCGEKAFILVSKGLIMGKIGIFWDEKAVEENCVKILGFFH